MRASFERRYRPQTPSITCSNIAWTYLGAEGEQAQKGQRPFRVGHLGSLTIDKGLAELPNVIQALIAEGIRAELWLAGSAPTPKDARELKSLLATLGPSRAKWLGVLDGARKADFYRSIDVFVMPTRYRNEAQPLVVFEAMLSGVPVVAFDAGCIPSQIRDSGLIVPNACAFTTYALPYLRRVAGDPDALHVERMITLETIAKLKIEAEAEARSLLRRLSNAA